MSETPTTFLNSDRLTLIQQAAIRSGTGALHAAGIPQKQSPFDVSQISGVSISHIERPNLDGIAFVSELIWLQNEASSHYMLDAELWTNELLAHCPEKLMTFYANTVDYEERNDSDGPLNKKFHPTGSQSAVERFRHLQQSKFAAALMRDRDFNRARFLLKKTREHIDSDRFMYYRCKFLGIMQDYLELDAENLERRMKNKNDKVHFAELYDEMTVEKLREDPDVFFEYLIGLLEMEIGLKQQAYKTMKSCVFREPRLWPAWETMAKLVASIEEADKVVVELKDRSLWMADWFMVLVLQRFHQDMLAITKAEVLVKRGMTNMPFIIAEIAACSNHRHDHDQAISNFEQIRAMDPYRIKGLHLFSDSLYIRSDKTSLSKLALALFETHRFRWETCCVVANYYAVRRENEQAIKYFQRALRLNPGVASIWVLIGHEFMEIKNNSAACVAYRKAIEVDPADYRGWYGLGQLYDILKMPSYSLYYYQQAQKCKPHDSRMLVALGEVYSKVNRIYDAEKCFSGAYLFGDIEGGALWQLAKLYENISDDEKAAQTFEVYLVTYDRLTNMEENVVYAVAFLANHYYRKKNWEKAMDYANRCLEHDSICQEGNRLFREIGKAQDAEMALMNKDSGESGNTPIDDEMAVASDNDEEVSF
ncbi:unnamed protein product [Caenorhabditis auriculariae]|uniref:Cdc23 domain-containing protein n=1 Tax=Caenorhabditis auriculariae TaxID=2777116 RepID=A0A8S1HYI6_9PELO|nr:unnamed protein product [Caenorhabditis auriculariae]